MDATFDNVINHVHVKGQLICLLATDVSHRLEVGLCDDRKNIARCQRDHRRFIVTAEQLLGVGVRGQT